MDTGSKLAGIRSCRWAVGGIQLTGAEVVFLYWAIARGAPEAEQLACVNAVDKSSRRWDRAIGILKREGLARYVRGKGREVAP